MSCKLCRGRCGVPHTAARFLRRLRQPAVFPRASSPLPRPLVAPRSRTAAATYTPPRPTSPCRLPAPVGARLARRRPLCPREHLLDAL
ncbi:hypothetical protein PAHAL_9G104200 [Panicum hallii]|uniref:Uncharacterized protein n=1 Tax=Panicum hallii TaxID=206008 RepID=A0A2T8I0S4_9POAL|nr:hypothetical protein PAHAL_9G104200 [Panicum hallii]